ncbi:MAG: hypothetical protein EBY62_10735, partial [Cellvibrionales bacterium]|nr:hypothetical protein [Cellvibrionales bacterium]
MAELRVDPFFIDINLVSTLDMLQQLTDYVDILVEFPDETAVNHMYWHTNSHSDPITSKIELFKSLNNNNVALNNNPSGVKQQKTTPDRLQNKNIRDQLHKTQHVITETGDKYGAISATDDQVDVNMLRTDKTWSELIPGQTHENANGV